MREINIKSAEDLEAFLEEHFQRLANLDETTDWSSKDWFYAGVVINFVVSTDDDVLEVKPKKKSKNK